MPPKTLDELRNLVNQIHTGEAELSLGPRAFQTLARLIDEPRQAAVYSITDLAANLGINASTLTRLAKRLGYRGFNELQDIFRHFVASGQTYFYSHQVDRIVHPTHGGQKTMEVFLEVVGDETRNIQKLSKEVDPQLLNDATQLLCTARNVRIHGLRQFYSLANFFSYGLGLIRDRVSILGEAGHGVAHSLSQLNEDDALVVMGCNPYTRATVDAGRIASKYGIPVLAFTDSSASPLAGNSHYTVVIPSTGRFYVNSTAAWSVLLEGLLTLVARRLGDDAITTLKTRERLFNELGITI
ncbi:MAG: DNA-binding MurR/RpiR family transcriptional regulator [Parasphingorhabdus sp.]|jgi:DNA-binding MurR/RpiR family transcriptional regulator